MVAQNKTCAGLAGAVLLGLCGLCINEKLGSAEPRGLGGSEWDWVRSGCEQLGQGLQFLG